MARNKSFCEAEVLEKALQLFHKDGYENVSVQDLVDHLGISRSSLYETYGSKEELFVEVLKSYRQENAREAINQLRNPDDAYETLKTFFVKSLNLACEDKDKKGCLMINSILDASHNSISEVRQIIFKNKNEIIEALSHVIQKGQEQGTIRHDLNPEHTAIMLFALHNGLIANSRIESDPLILLSALDTGLQILHP